MRNVLPHLHLRNLAFVVYALLLAAPHLGAQETSGAQETNDIPPDQVRTAPEQRPTLLLYSQHRLPEELWAALFTALRANLPEIAAKVPANEANPEFVRGETPQTEIWRGRRSRST